MNQRTVASDIRFEGIGIHSGKSSSVAVHPANVGAGRVFLANGVRFPARADHVVSTMRCTTLGSGSETLSVVEHLLSAMFALEVDNALIEVDGAELPILDGSAQPYVEAILATGLVDQELPAERLTLTDRIEIENRGSRVVAMPGRNLTITADVQFDDWPQGDATASWNYGAADEYVARIAPARTFAFRSEVDVLIAAGFARGGSLDNALIITPPNEFSTPQRVNQEWCAHKLLDAIGDLALVGCRIDAEIVASRPGHAINNLMARALLKRRELNRTGS